MESCLSPKNYFFFGKSALLFPRKYLLGSRDTALVCWMECWTVQKHVFTISKLIFFLRSGRRLGLCLPELEKLGYYGLRCELKKESFILLKKVSIHTSNYFSQRLSRLLAGLGGQRRAGVKVRGGRPSEEKHGFVVFVNPALFKSHATEQSYYGTRTDFVQ